MSIHPLASAAWHSLEAARRYYSDAKHTPRGRAVQILHLREAAALARRAAEELEAAAAALEAESL